MMKRRLITVLAVVIMTLGVMSPVSADGINAEQLEAQGWVCFAAGPASPQNIHCLSPNQGQGKAASAMVFSGSDGSYLGTETLRFTSKDLSELPCPKDGGHWQYIPTDTWACHHWKGAPSS